MDEDGSKQAEVSRRRREHGEKDHAVLEDFGEGGDEERVRRIGGNRGVGRGRGEFLFRPKPIRTISGGFGIN